MPVFLLQLLFNMLHLFISLRVDFTTFGDLEVLDLGGNELEGSILPGKKSF